MVYKPKGRRFYIVKFVADGKVIQKRTKATNEKAARKIEAALRNALALGDVGIFERKPAPPLAEFLKQDFLPYSESKFKDKPGTLQYYRDGVKRLLASEIARLRLSEITDQHARQFEGHWSLLSPSTINCGLRSLRRALSLATEWGKIDRMPKIRLAKGERQRERVLTREEAAKYLGACPQPWRDGAVVILGTGMRPGEVYQLRWEYVLLNGHNGLIQVAKGKSKAARRLLPMLPAVYQTLKTRHEAQGFPSEGWVFPTGSNSGHMEESSTKKWHAKALASLKKARKENPDLPEVKPFEPYCLRHTGLTWLGEEAGGDVFALARVAGHSSIITTQRYIHPQAETIERLFEQAARRELVTAGGYQAKMLTSGSEEGKAVTYSGVNK
jgi:integrase